MKYVNTHKCTNTQRTYGVYTLENVRLLSASIVVSAFLIAIAVYQLALAGYQIAEAGRFHAVVLHDDDEFPRVLVLDSISQRAQLCHTVGLNGMRCSHVDEVFKPQILRIIKPEQ